MKFQTEPKPTARIFSVRKSYRQHNSRTDLERPASYRFYSSGFSFSIEIETKMHLEIKPGLIILIVLVSMSCLLTCVSMTTNCWVINDHALTHKQIKSSYSGLWKSCVAYGSASATCKEFIATTGKVTQNSKIVDF